MTEREASFTAALRAAVEGGARWVCVPATVMPTEDLLTRGLAEAAGLLGEDLPVLVVHLAREGDGPAVPPEGYRGVALLTDASTDSQVSARAAARLARLAGTAVRPVDVSAASGPEEAVRQVEGAEPDLVVVELGAAQLEALAAGEGAELDAVQSSDRGRLVNDLLSWLAVDVAIVVERPSA